MKAKLRRYRRRLWCWWVECKREHCWISADAISTMIAERKRQDSPKTEPENILANAAPVREERACVECGRREYLKNKDWINFGPRSQ